MSRKTDIKAELRLPTEKLPQKVHAWPSNEENKTVEEKLRKLINEEEREV